MDPRQRPGRCRPGRFAVVAKGQGVGETGNEIRQQGACGRLSVGGLVNARDSDGPPAARAALVLDRHQEIARRLENQLAQLDHTPVGASLREGQAQVVAEGHHVDRRVFQRIGHFMRFWLGAGFDEQDHRLGVGFEDRGTDTRAVGVLVHVRLQRNERLFTKGHRHHVGAREPVRRAVLDAVPERSICGLVGVDVAAAGEGDMVVGRDAEFRQDRRGHTRWRHTRVDAAVGVEKSW